MALAGLPEGSDDDAPDARIRAGRDTLVDRAVSAAARIEDHETRGRLVAGIADLQRGLGRFEEAATLLKEAVAELDRSRFVRPLLRQMLAEVCRRTENWSTALVHLDDAEAALLDRTDDAPPAVADFHREVRSLVHGARAQIWTELGVWEEAARALAEEERLAASTASLGDDVAHVAHRADNLVARRRFAEAARLLEQTLAIPEIAAAPAASDLLRGYLGVALTELERLDPTSPRAATTMLEAAVASRAVSDVTRAVFLLHLADTALRDGRLDDAELRLARAAAILDRTSATVHETALLEAHRTRLLLSRGANRDDVAAQHERLESAFRVFLHRWTAAPAREGSIGFLHLGTRRLVLSALIRSTLTLTPGPPGAEAALQHLLAAQAKGSQARSRRLETPSLEAIRRELLAEGEGILAYLPSMEGSYVFAVDRETVLPFELERGADLYRVCRPLAEALLRTTAPARLDSLARAVSDRIVPPAVEARLRAWSAVTVVGGDLLFEVPIESLPLSDGRRFGEAIAVAHLPSLPLGMMLAARPGPPDDALRLLLIAAPRPSHRPTPPHPALPALPFDAAVATRLTGAFGIERVEVRLGDAATAERLRSEPLPVAAITHLLAHGTYDLGRERGAGLVLHGDGSRADVLFCEDVERSLSTSGLVVLSACGAANGPSRMGDDRLAHLGGAFLNAGARAVVVSRADLEFHATIELMESFHERLAAGDSPAAALSAARRRAAKGGDPYHGARFQVVGLATRPLFSAPLTGVTTADRPIRRAGLIAAAALLGLVVAAFGLVAAGRRARSHAAGP